MQPPTTIIMVRNGETLWGQEGKLLGRRDIGITERGKQQSLRSLELLKKINVSEILASPQARAIQTAEYFANHFELGIGRDPRLMDLDVGPWEGHDWQTILGHADFVELFAGRAVRFPDGEELEAARSRAVASVEDAAVDNPAGAYILLITHASIIRLILTHYLGMPAGAFVFLQISCGSLSVLRFSAEMTQPQVIGTNLAVPLNEMFVEVPD